ncbi:MAG TPA: hypothetical protein VHG27_07805 [Xanthobacteraceae bacterium]|nr:hypothetical protein [Xanthobacteraceae bacterium]
MNAAAETDGARFARGLAELMNALLAVIEQETELVRAGRLAEAATLGTRKSELAGGYVAELVRMKANAASWLRETPDALETLRRRHDAFRSLLQINLTVLATAQAVAEGIIRGAADQVARKASPQAYGAGGRVLNTMRSVQPVALSQAF